MYEGRSSSCREVWSWKSWTDVSSGRGRLGGKPAEDAAQLRGHEYMGVQGSA